MGWKDVGEGAVSSIENAGQQGADAVGDAGQKAADAVGDAAQKAADALADAGASAANNIANKGGEGADLVAGEVRKAAASVEAHGRHAAAAVAAQGRSAAHAIATQARAAAGAIAGEIDRIRTALGSAEYLTPPSPPPSNRHLTDAEIALARMVFKDTLNYRKIYLSPRRGLGLTGYTVPRIKCQYVIHIGPLLYDDATNPTGQSFPDPRGKPFADKPAEAVFIHELTHVWQGEWWPFPAAYVLNSLAYLLDPGGEWKYYAAEQPAMIVQDWYTGGGQSGDSTGLDTGTPLFPYIQDHIWTGSNT